MGGAGRAVGVQEERRRTVPARDMPAGEDPHTTLISFLAARTGSSTCTGPAPAGDDASSAGRKPLLSIKLRGDRVMEQRGGGKQRGIYEKGRQ